MLTVNAMAAADSVLIPIEPEYYALDGMAELLRVIRNTKKRYQKHCVEKLSLEEMMKTTRLTETALNMFVKYFDVREKQDK